MNLIPRKLKGHHLCFRRQTLPGHTPGTVVADPAAEAPVVRVISYGAADFEDAQVDDLDVLPEILGKRRVTWVDVQGRGDADVVKRLGGLFSLHPLALEDIVHTHQRSGCLWSGRLAAAMFSLLATLAHWKLNPRL